MNEQLNILFENYKDGIPVKVEQSSVIMLSVAIVITTTICALIVKYIKKL